MGFARARLIAMRELRAARLQGTTDTTCIGFEQAPATAGKITATYCNTRSIHCRISADPTLLVKPWQAGVAAVSTRTGKSRTVVRAAASEQINRDSIGNIQAATGGGQTSGRQHILAGKIAQGDSHRRQREPQRGAGGSVTRSIGMVVSRASSAATTAGVRSLVKLPPSAELRSNSTPQPFCA